MSATLPADMDLDLPAVPPGAAVADGSVHDGGSQSDASTLTTLEISDDEDDYEDDEWQARYRGKVDRALAVSAAAVKAELAVPEGGMDVDVDVSEEHLEMHQQVAEMDVQMEAGEEPIVQQEQATAVELGTPNGPGPVSPITPPASQVPRELATDHSLRRLKPFAAVGWRDAFNWEDPLPPPLAVEEEDELVPEEAPDTIAAAQRITVPFPSAFGIVDNKPEPTAVPPRTATSSSANKLPSIFDHPAAAAAGIEVDPRIDPAGVKFVDGQAHALPHCTHCKEKRRFCSRGFPCVLCTELGLPCNLREEYAPLRKKKRASEVGAVAPVAKKPKYVPGAKVPKATVRRRAAAAVAPAVPTPPPVPAPVVEPVEELPRVPKPPPIGKPPVFAEGRQELCESVPYYRAYQGGAYTNGGLVRGYLVDKFSGDRDYMNNKVVISHAGGKSGVDEETGQRALKSDQTSDDVLIRSMRANRDNQIPLVVILGAAYKHSPSEPPHRYNVMDWFKVTHVWAEKEDSKVRMKFRFEKLDSSTDGWWSAEPSPEMDPETVSEASCVKCQKASPHVYEFGWSCLEPTCSEFWKTPQGLTPTEFQYTTNFLYATTPWDPTLTKAPYPLCPTPAALLAAAQDGSDVTRSSWKGFCCPECGRASSRSLWCGWRCNSCYFWVAPRKSLLDIYRLTDAHKPFYTGVVVPNDTVNDERIRVSKTVRDGFTVMQYELPDECGTVTHILATQGTNARERDADWLLEHYQHPQMNFQRHVLPNHKVAGLMLTNQFSFNSGEPYKFIVDVSSVPFDKSPPVVQRALEVLHDRVKLVQPDTHFNEILSVGYFEHQKMDYHDDGEKGLGPTVASISLGASATMRFRLKNKGKNKVPTIKGSKKDKLILDLNHGDVMIMSGARIQEVYEHAVACEGLFRVAATARFIDSRNETERVPRNNAAVGMQRQMPLGAENDEVLREQAEWGNDQWHEYLGRNLGFYGRGSEKYPIHDPAGLSAFRAQREGDALVSETAEMGVDGKDEMEE